MYACLHVNMPQDPLPSTLHTVGVSGVMGVCELVTTKPRGFPILTIHQHEVKDKVQTGFFPRFNPNFLVSNTACKEAITVFGAALGSTVVTP